MRADEAMKVGRTGGEAFAGAVARIEDLHGAIAERAMGRRSPIVRGTHDRIAAAVYTTVAGVGKVAVQALGAGLALTRDPDAPPLRDTPRGAAVLGALAGAFGDRVTGADGLELPMTLRRRGRDLPIDPAALAAAFPVPTGRVAVLVHGLCCTDATWRIPVRHRDVADPRPEDEVPYEVLLRRDCGIDAVVLRYDSGRRIPQNGVELAELLERLCAAWPGGVRELILVGHSMGSLVARSACAAGTALDHEWTDRVTQTVSLGGPHLGANLERGAATVQAALGLLPETRPLAALLGLRSAGVLDLRDGLLSADDVPEEIDRWPWGERGSVTPQLPHARHHAVGATLARDPTSFLGDRVLGDLLVHGASATGRTEGERRLTFADGDAVVLGGLDHFDLLRHPRVAAHLRTWLRPRPALPPAGATG